MKWIGLRALKEHLWRKKKRREKGQERVEEGGEGGHKRTCLISV